MVTILFKREKEMNIDKKTIFAFLLIGLVFITVQTPIYQKIFFPKSYELEQMKKNAPAQSKETEEYKTVKTEVLNDKTNQRTVKENYTYSSQSDKKEDSKNFIIETDLYKATFTNKGATLKEWILKKYKMTDRSPVTLISEKSPEDFALSFVTRGGDTVKTGNWIFSTETSDSVISIKGESYVLKFQFETDPGKKIIKEYKFNKHSYDFELRVIFENFGEIISDKAYSLYVPSGLLYTEKRLSEDEYYAKAIVAAGGQVNKSYKYNGINYSESGNIDWIAERTKYFTMVIIPKTQKGTSATISGEELSINGQKGVKWKKINLSLSMPFTRNDIDDRFIIFIGPMHDDLLKSYNVGLEKIMDMGAKIIQPFSIAILWTFKKIHLFIPNYGLVLVIFSILIKIIVSPLTQKSFASMKKMQILQPKLIELKEKYAKDPQRLNKETMKLYKEEGVNPMGGCLPILLQMPLLWALYIVFRSTIELRQQGFVWWIKDLSSPDTIATLPFSIPLYGDSVNILPILMGVTMIWQQKMSITDPKQKAMIYMMPIFMTLLFNSFPSGLNLYYTLFNILSIVHQKYILGDGKISDQPKLKK